jgi:2-dehydropantoate 2-reductase
MGCLWGGYLTTACQVAFALRERRAPAIHYDLQQPDGVIRAFTIPVCQPTDRPPDLVLLTTKAHQAVAGLTQAKRWLGPQIPVLLFQNGMGSQQAIARHFTELPLIAAVTTEGAYRETAAKLVHGGYGETRLGGLNQSGENALATAADLLAGSGLRVRVEAQIHTRLWQKLAVNAGINAFTVILDCYNGALLGAPFFEQHIGSVCEEVGALMTASGIRTHPSDLERQVRHVAYQTMDNSSSMRQDIKAGKTTEIDMINGFVVRESLANRLEAPVNQMLVEAVKQREPR